MKKWIMALDQGTTSSRAILFDTSGKAHANVAQEFPQYFPQPGWVEHDPWDIWNTTKACMQAALKEAAEKYRAVAADKAEDLKDVAAAAWKSLKAGWEEARKTFEQEKK